MVCFLSSGSHRPQSLAYSLQPLFRAILRGQSTRIGSRRAFWLHRFLDRIISKRQINGALLSEHIAPRKLLPVQVESPSSM